MQNPSLFSKFTCWRACLLAGLFFPGILPAQPAEIKWLPPVRSSKDQHTLALLRAGDDGFYLLRWQDSRTDAKGNRTPALPILTALTPGGDRLHDAPLPGFAEGRMDFRFALANDSVLLAVYEAPNSAGTQTLFARRLNLAARKWAAEPQVVFTDASGRAPAFATAWYSRSADGSHYCLYRLSGGTAYRAALAVLDRDFRTVWQRQAELPAPKGQMVLRQALCTNSGAVLVHGQLFDTGSPGRPYEAPPAVSLPDGRPFSRQAEWTGAAPAISNALFLLGSGNGDPTAFYPNTGKKYTPSFEIAEGPDSRLYAAGLSSNANNEQAEAYFVYAIEPEKRTGSFLQNAALPGAVRKAYLSEKAAAKKEPVEGLALRWLHWAADGTPWMLAERQYPDANPGRVEQAALLRLDSSYRIGAVRTIEKYQRLPAGTAQCFASVGPRPGPKSGWWLLWNEGSWPNAKIMLTECRSGGAPMHHVLDASSNSNVSLLPHTLQLFGNRWYFVGESEYRERVRVGILEGAEKGKR
ncbi:MAG: hypothetical protein IPH12_03950 [Saprospirales bacterium]|nr:hypothetical protein [Saprospirales bacterium]